MKCISVHTFVYNSHSTWKIKCHCFGTVDLILHFDFIFTWNTWTFEVNSIHSDQSRFDFYKSKRNGGQFFALSLFCKNELTLSVRKWSLTSLPALSGWELLVYFDMNLTCTQTLEEHQRLVCSERIGREQDEHTEAVWQCIFEWYQVPRGPRNVHSLLSCSSFLPSSIMQKRRQQ